MEGSNGNVKSGSRTMFLKGFPTLLTSQKSLFETRNVKKLAYLLYFTISSFRSSCLFTYTFQNEQRGPKSESIRPDNVPDVVSDPGFTSNIEV